MEDHPLTYKRTKLVEVLRDRLVEAEKKRADEKAKAAERNKKVRDQIVELIDEYPQFLVYVASRLHFRDGALLPSSEAYKEFVKEKYEPRPEATTDSEPDAKIKRLIRVYDQAVDDTVKVSVNDDIFSYL